MTQPCLFVGLGNPGEKYQLNRHNVGFLVLDAVAKAFNTPRYISKYQGLFTEGKSISGQESHPFFLLKPMTFMNVSGKAVGEVVRFFKIPLERVYVVHDDLDIEPGKIKIKVGGGNGGHNGLSSIDQHIGKEYTRIRIGIGHPGHRDLVSPYVLGNFSKNDQIWLLPLLEIIGQTLPHLMVQDKGDWINTVVRFCTSSS